MTGLPIDTILPDLKQALESYNNVVLVAPPGAGKTTRIPIALLDEQWIAGRRILMLEPRRLAARSAARYMAASLHERIGETVGYRMKQDTRVGPNTRIEVITEGVLTRLIQSDPSLEDVGIVIFDEFHERSLHADLGLALCLQSQSVLREDLKILVMSATIDTEPVSALLNQAPIVTSLGRAFPIETHYIAQHKADDRLEAIVSIAIRNAIEQHEGDILVFLPGAGEIRRTEARLTELKLGKQVRIASLYGNMPQEAQDQAIAPSVPGERKIVLATSIAETSITVDGVRIVIDCGLMRVSRFSPRTGMTRLVTIPVSKASADQRRGRAGRQGPGICYRLWTLQEDRALAPHSVPEILEADLAPLALELAAWGAADPAELSWLDRPPAAAYQQARELLSQLGAVGESGTLLPHGKNMAELGLHPRLSHMILKAVPLGLGGLACELAALLTERNLFRGVKQAAPDIDLRTRVELLRSANNGAPSADSLADSSMDYAACRRIYAEVNQWKRELRIPSVPNDADQIGHCGLLLAFAYPDRIAQRRTPGRFLLRNGRGAAFTQSHPLYNMDYLVTAELDDLGAESRIMLAAPIDLSELELHFKEQFEEQALITWDMSIHSVRARKLTRLGAIVLQDSALSDPPHEEVLNALIEGIQSEGLTLLPWSKSSRQIQQRIQFMRQHEVNWPEVSDAQLITTLHEWLSPYLYRMKSGNDLKRLNLTDILAGMLTWDQRRELDEYAPTHILVPSGSRIPIDYSEPMLPTVSVRLQEMFGQAETPRLARGAIPLTLHLLSPAHRPVQVTRDLASFWRKTYFEVKKDLKGRYPKHYWPDDPLCAIPTNRVRPRV